MHVRLHHERVHAGLERLLLAHADQLQPLPHHQLVQLLEQRGGEQADVAHHAAVREILRTVEFGQAQQAAHIAVFVGQFGEPIEIALQALLA